MRTKREQGLRSATHWAVGNTHRVGNTIGGVCSQSGKASGMRRAACNQRCRGFPPLQPGGGLGRGQHREQRTPITILASLLLLLTQTASADSYTLIISGLGGEPQYEQRFQEQAEQIATNALASAESPEHVIKLVGAEVTRDKVRQELASLAKQIAAEDVMTVVLIGHGTYDGEEYRFNIPGPDLTGTELRALLDALPAREQLIVNTTSASGATVDKWAQPGRVLIAATKSGGERTATRFAQYWAEALKGGNADTNKDEIVTASEAFEFANRQVAAAFKADVSLATEHARIEGQDLAASFAVARRGTATLSDDPEVRALFAQRAGLERELDAVKQKRGALPEDEYYNELEAVLVQFARLQQQIDAKQPEQMASP